MNNLVDKSWQKSPWTSAICLIATLACFLSATGCNRPEVPTSVKISNGLLFSLSGSGRLASFTISAPLNGQKIAVPCDVALLPCSGVASIVWQVVPSRGYYKGTRVEGLQIAYGKAPPDYDQTTPSRSLTAPPLTTGAIYGFFAETTEGAGHGGHIYVDRTGGIQAVQVDLCMTLKNNQWSRINCKTQEPYQEPENIDRYAQEHRITTQ
jgi:hypothetical protein